MCPMCTILQSSESIALLVAIIEFHGGIHRGYRTISSDFFFVKRYMQSDLKCHKPCRTCTYNTKPLLPRVLSLVVSLGCSLVPNRLRKENIRGEHRASLITPLLSSYSGGILHLHFSVDHHAYDRIRLPLLCQPPTRALFVVRRRFHLFFQKYTNVHGHMLSCPPRCHSLHSP